MAGHQCSEELPELLTKLRAIAAKGPILSVSTAANGVGLTLLSELDLMSTSAGKANYHGIVVSARCARASGARNRVNLFAMVPNWKMSPCKSSKEILMAHGYDVPGGVRKLYCTVRANTPNSQGLFFDVDLRRQLLQEKKYISEGKSIHVVTWNITDIASRLMLRHPESVWVRAEMIHLNRRVYYRYVEATYTGPPNTEFLSHLLDEGTITVDHLIQKKEGRVTEKGPFFKVDPSNLGLIFPVKKQFNLLA